jgi:hypothetical protein
MSPPQGNDPDCPCPPSQQDLRRQLHDCLDRAIDACLHDHPDSSFLHFEAALRGHLSALGLLLLQMFLLVRHQRLDLLPWKQRGFRIADGYAPRDLHTTCGLLRYGRAYLIPHQGQQGPGVHPLDAELGLTRDSYTPQLISWFCRLCTLVSFRCAADLGKMFLGWTPAASTIEEWALGLGRPAYVWLSTAPLPPGDGEVLVIECDGKAAPTATEQELHKRRQPRQNRAKACGCHCKRHRGRACRKAHGHKKKRKRGDKSKNGRSATLVVMYTLKREADGRLHGPINKKVFATFSSRQKALQWAREQATRRGFPPGSAKTVQVIVDGEVCLERQLRQLFPQAILTLDIRHAQERLWRVGRLLYPEGSEALSAWVEPLTELLYKGEVPMLLQRLQEVEFRGPGSKAKRKAQKQAEEYLRKREGLMQYGRWREQDLVLASGVVEGAARHVIGERLDNSGMRWVVQRAEALLLLRCIEVNGDWDAFFAFSEQQRQQDLRAAKVVQIRSKTPTQLPELNQKSEKERRSRQEAKAAAQTPVAA